jgi:hypothetical protein
MRIQDIKLNEYYRLASSPNYGYIKPIKIYPAKMHPKKFPFITIECEHTLTKNDTMRFIRLFRPRDIIRG